MSDIAKKTLPPGSRPGQKPKAPSKADSAVDGTTKSAPRSVPPTEDVDDDNNNSVAETGSAGNYTHTQQGQDQGLDDIQEQEEGSSIQMTDKEQTQGLDEVQPKPADEESTGGETEDQRDDVTESAAIASSKTSLTERAKEALDKASAGEDTAEAREEFLRSVQQEEGQTEPAMTEKTKSETAGAAGMTEGAQTERAESEVQHDDDVTEKGEEVAPTEQGGDVVDQIAQKAQSTTEAAPTEDGAPMDKAESEVDSKTAEGIDVRDTAPKTAETATEGGVPETAETETQGIPEAGETETQGVPETGEAETQAAAETVTEGTEGGQETAETAQETATQGPQDSVTVPEMLDFSVLKGGKVNKGGNVVDSNGKVVGRVVEGILTYLVNKRVDENGDIWSDNGKVIGKAEPITDSEREDMMREPAPFESFPDAVVDGNGMVVSNGEWVGKVIEGDVKKLRGKSVDPDGDILDKGGNLIGKAERWEPEEEPEAEPEAEVDNSALAGKRVNKAGNVVDSSGTIYGRVIEGDVKKMVGRMCDKKGNILSESGDIIGKAELVPEGEREGSKDGPFAELSGCTVAKDGTIVTPSGDVVGRLVSGDPKVLFGRAVDEDGDILDRNGNSIGKAERWEPEKVEKKKNRMSGRRVNKEANVVDEDGNIIGKLTSGDPSVCAGKEIDDDGDVVDGKGTVIGHCSLLEDIPKEEQAEMSPEEKEKLERAEQDRKLAIQMSVCIEQCLDKIRPICKMITEKIDKAERTPEDERDEEALVREVRPLIEEGGRILQEAKGIIKGLDPDGRISANAKHKTAAREATPEEYHLADVLKDLTGDVTQCIENNKKKLEDMPHAKKELNPLWGLLNEPLFQILAAVGLLLSGVLGLVGRLLSGLGLGGLLDGLLGTLGINRVLEGLGIGSLTGGKKKKKEGGGGGLLGGVLGG